MRPQARVSELWSVGSAVGIGMIELAVPHVPLIAPSDAVVTKISPCAVPHAQRVWASERIAGKGMPVTLCLGAILG